MNWEETRNRLIEINEKFDKLPVEWKWRIDLADTDLGGTNLKGADFKGADLGGADFRYADLGGADFRYADLGGADLRDANLGGADLRDADLRGITVNWNSRCLISEILWRAADTPKQEMLAAWVGRKTEWCWEEWLEIDHSECGWALAELRKWVKGGDNAPPVLHEVAQ